MNIKIVVVVLAMLAGLVMSVHAQTDDTCSTLVQTAYETTQTACEATGHDEACYGNLTVQAEPQASAEDFEFDSPGDLVNVAAIGTLRLSSWDEVQQEWGIMLMNVQANLPDDSAESIEILLFGDVEIENTVSSEQPEPVLINITAQNDLNVRAAPSTNDEVIGRLRFNEVAVADGRNEAGDWLRITLPDSEDSGWVYAPLITTEDAIADLLVTDPNAVSYNPMQAFYFRSTKEDSPCTAAPDSGILIQTPEGAGEITFVINEVIIELGSTVYLTAAPDGDMIISVVEGEITVTADGETITVPAGTLATVPLDTNGRANGVPQGPEPYLDSTVASLPTLLLSQIITIAPAMSDADLQTFLAPPEDTSSPASNLPTPTPAPLSNRPTPTPGP